MYIADTPDSESQQHSELETVHCWACSVLVRVPQVQGVPAPVYKCGWCGAITDTQQGLSSLSGKRGSQQPRKLYSRIIQASQAFIVALVALLILSILGTGVAFALPRYCSSAPSWLLHLALTATLTFNIAFNYVACIRIRPAQQLDCRSLPENGTKPVAQDAYADFTFCKACKASKPPHVHHCSICRACVVDMDHHCPFISNCVGRANLRNFILFLLYATAATAYAVFISSVLLVRHWDSASSSLNGLRDESDGWFDYLSTALVLLVSEAPGWYLATVYTCWASLAVVIGVGSLLLSQLRYAMMGVAFVTSLKGGGVGQARPKGKLAQLRSVLGPGHWSTWLLPRWGQGSAAAGRVDKTS